MGTGTSAAPPSGAAHASASPPSLAETGARIGPNAVLQTLRATRARCGESRAAELRRALGLPDPLPPGMIPEAWFVAAVRWLRHHLPGDSEAILALSGGYTGDYVTANRIPGPFRALLRALPSRLAVPLLLRAFRHHAWTFAGSGAFRRLLELAAPGIRVRETACQAEGHDACRFRLEL